MRQKQGVFSLFLLSPSSRRAWIEITKGAQQQQTTCVALLAEGVDRNDFLLDIDGCSFLVALLAEGVDRNVYQSLYCCTSCVALLAEGVDRNSSLLLIFPDFVSRPPRGGRG